MPSIGLKFLCVGRTEWKTVMQLCKTCRGKKRGEKKWRAFFSWHATTSYHKCSSQHLECFTPSRLWNYDELLAVFREFAGLVPLVLAGDSHGSTRWMKVMKVDGTYQRSFTRVKHPLSRILTASGILDSVGTCWGSFCPQGTTTRVAMHGMQKVSHTMYLGGFVFSLTGMWHAQCFLMLGL